MRSPNNRLPVAHALALGALQGPAELLPISSSAHTTAIPWLLGWNYSELEPELRKSFEAVLHAGTALALAISLRNEILSGSRRSVLVAAAASVPPAIAGYALEREIEARLGTPATIAAGLIAGSAALMLADRAPSRRSCEDARLVDGLWLGLAQSFALTPGISRSGATLSAARLLGFARRDAERLSTGVGLPVLTGAAALKAIRLSRAGLEPGSGRAFVAGVAASFVSTLACLKATENRRYIERLAPYAAYRIGLAALILLRGGSTAPLPGGAAR